MASNDGAGGGGSDGIPNRGGTDDDRGGSFVNRGNHNDRGGSSGNWGNYDNRRRNYNYRNFSNRRGGYVHHNRGWWNSGNHGGYRAVGKEPLENKVSDSQYDAAARKEVKDVLQYKDMGEDPWIKQRQELIKMCIGMSSILICQGESMKMLGEAMEKIAKEFQLQYPAPATQEPEPVIVENGVDSNERVTLEGLKKISKSELDNANDTLAGISKSKQGMGKGRKVISGEVGKAAEIADERSRIKHEQGIVVVVAPPKAPEVMPPQYIPEVPARPIPPPGVDSYEHVTLEGLKQMSETTLDNAYNTLAGIAKYKQELGKWQKVTSEETRKAAEIADERSRIKLEQGIVVVVAPPKAPEVMPPRYIRKEPARPIPPPGVDSYEHVTLEGLKQMSETELDNAYDTLTGIAKYKQEMGEWREVISGEARKAAEIADERSRIKHEQGLMTEVKD